MYDNTTIRQELDQISAMLEGLRGPLPAPLAEALTGNDWIRSQLPADALRVQARGKWAPAVAAASLTAGLFTSPPGYALPSTGPLTQGNLGGLIPAPPLVLAPGATLDARLDAAVAASSLPSAPSPTGPRLPSSPTRVSLPSEAALHPVPAADLSASASGQLAPEARQPAQPAARPDQATGTAALPPEQFAPTGSPPAPGAGGADLPEGLHSAPAREREVAPAVDLPFRSRQESRLAAPPATAEGNPGPQPRPAKQVKKRSAGVHEPGTSRTLAHPALRWHTIRPGETLIRLARHYYQGAGGRWKGIFAFNRSRIADAHRVFPGQQILIPTLAEALAAERGDVPYLAAHARPPRMAASPEPMRRGARWRHKTRIAGQPPILKPKPGVPI